MKNVILVFVVLLLALVLDLCYDYYTFTHPSVKVGQVWVHKFKNSSFEHEDTIVSVNGNIVHFKVNYIGNKVLTGNAFDDSENIGLFVINAFKKGK